jgi:hypothetical protein
MNDLILIKNTVEKVIVIGNNKLKNAVVNQYKADGYRIIHTGAKPLGLKMYSKKEFKMIAEKIINQ